MINKAEEEDDDKKDDDDDGDGQQDFAEEIMNSISSGDSMDRRGTFVGTVNYLSPEMI